MQRLLFIFSFILSSSGFCQDQLKIVDIQSYNVYLVVWEEHDTILVNEQVQLKLLQQVDSFYLDLHWLEAGKGMVVSKLTVQSESVPFTHRDN